MTSAWIVASLILIIEILVIYIMVKSRLYMSGMLFVIALLFPFYKSISIISNGLFPYPYQIIELFFLLFLFLGVVSLFFRYQQYQLLLNQKNEFQSLIEDAVIGIYRTTPDGKILFANKALLTMLGYETLEELQERNLEEEGFEPKYSRSLFKQLLNAVGYVIGLESAWRTRKGNTVYVRENAKLVRDKQGKPLYYVGTVDDISDRKKAEQAYQETNSQFRQFAENIDSIFWIVSTKERKLIYLNKSYEKITGIPRYKIYEDMYYWFNYIHPDDRKRIEESFEKNLQGQNFGIHEFRMVRPDGNIIWIKNRIIPLQNQVGNIYRIAGIADDITDRKINEEWVRKSLYEKEVLLQEIHHRVKNNLQTISSLFDIIAIRSKNSHVQKILNDARTKIHGMALIHNQLYKSKHFNQIDMNIYMQDLFMFIKSLFAEEQKNIQTEIHCSNVFLPMTQAVPCSMILNELITNAYQHGFKNSNTGLISVTIYIENNLCHINVYNNGEPCPETVSLGDTTSLGLKIVNNLVENQLQGRISLYRLNGTEFAIRFPLENNVE